MFEEGSMTTHQQDMKKGQEVPSQETVEAFAKKNRVAADDSVTKCVDGGYRPGESEGAIAFTGADVGLCLMLGAIKANDGQYLFTPKQAVELVYEFAVKEKGGFDWHTGSHAKDVTQLPEALQPHLIHTEGQQPSPPPECDCGFFNAAMIHGEAKYGLSSERVKDMHSTVLELQNSHSGDNTMRCVVLERTHNEKAILIVTGTTHTVRPWDIDVQTGHEGDQYFIFDKTRFELYLGKFASFLSDRGYEKITLDLLLRIFNAQLASTLGLLQSSQGKAIFEVNVDDENNIEVTTSNMGAAPEIAPDFEVDIRV